MAVVGRQPWVRQHGLNRPYWEEMRDTISGAFEASGERHEALLGAIALDFGTWSTLVQQQGLDQDRGVELMVGMVWCLMRT
jgi:hypothetical protein